MENETLDANQNEQDETIREAGEDEAQDDETTNRIGDAIKLMGAINLLHFK